MTTGQSMVDLPHARIAGGPRALVIFEGLTLENKAPTGLALRLLRWAHKRYTRDYTIYQVARRPGVDETAERIPQATLRRYDGVGHAVSKTHKRRFEDDVLGFLRG